MSPPIAADGKLFFTSEDGDTHVVRPGPEFEVLGSNALEQPVDTGLAVVDQSIYIRGAKQLFCIREKPRA